MKIIDKSLAAAAVAIVTTLGAWSAQGATVSCNVSDLTIGGSNSSACEGALDGNDKNTVSASGTYFSLTGWQEVAFVDDASGTDARLGLRVTSDDDEKSGGWSVSGWGSMFDSFMIALKGGPTYSLYLIDEMLGTSGTWATDGIAKGNGKPGPELSHFTIYATKAGNPGGGDPGGDPSPVPLPAGAWLLLSALAGAVGLRRMRRA